MLQIKKKKLIVFSYYKNMANFEAFLQSIELSVKFLSLKSATGSTLNVYTQDQVLLCPVLLAIVLYSLQYYILCTYIMAICNGRSSIFCRLQIQLTTDLWLWSMQIGNQLLYIFVRVLFRYKEDDEAQATGAALLKVTLLLIHQNQRLPKIMNTYCPERTNYND